jgi:hypothetical protein
MNRSPFLLALVMLALAGCAGLTGLEKRAFRPLLERSYPPREAPAEISRTPEAELRAQGYLLVGVAEVRQELQRCDDDGCSHQTYAEDATTLVRRIAAENGGDLVVLQKDNMIEKEPYELFGYCKVPEPRGPLGPSHTGFDDCLEYTKLHGVKEIRVSQGFVWRLEPAAARRESGRLGERLFPDEPKAPPPPER